ncbi:MAG TPA: hypothetical protein VHT50_20425 [Mycobacterium sp.]|nr:hypothetical protein [Mycobacterium sp.]
MLEYFAPFFDDPVQLPIVADLDVGQPASTCEAKPTTSKPLAPIRSASRLISGSITSRVALSTS